LPGSRDWAEREQPLVGQRGKELNREEWIASSLFMYQLRQGPRALRLAMQGIGDEPPDIVEPERCQHNLMQPRTSVTDRFKSPHQRMRRADLVVPVGPD
jgi:hypothetical protein